MKYFTLLIIMIVFCSCGKPQPQNLTNDPFYRRGERHLANNDYSKAKVSFEKSLDLGKSFAGHLKLAETYERLGDFEAAIFHYRKYLGFIGESNANFPLVNAMLQQARKMNLESSQDHTLAKISPREQLFKNRLAEVIIERNRLAKELKKSNLKTSVVKVAESAPIVSPPSDKEKKYYTVNKGDTLSDISMKFYQSTKHWRKIVEANKELFSDTNNRLKVGQKIIIPEIK